MPARGGRRESRVTDAHALIGIGDAFVGRVLELDAADSLASVARFTDAIDELGGTKSAGMAWLDRRRHAGGDRGRHRADAWACPTPTASTRRSSQPWLLPLDRFVTVSVVEGRSGPAARRTLRRVSSNPCRRRSFPSRVARNRGCRPRRRRLRAAGVGADGVEQRAGRSVRAHEHGFAKLLVCAEGSITFLVGDDEAPSELEAGEGFELPAGTRHAAVVGPEGCTCVEGHRR